jgi:transcriptional regulator with XRE-family HTH domain
MSLSNKIVEYRMKNGLTQDKLAEKIGVAKTDINDWELKGTLPDSSMYIHISKLLDIPIDDLMFGNNDLNNHNIHQQENEKEFYDFSNNYLKFEDSITIIDHNGKRIKGIDECYLLKISTTVKKQPKFKLEGHNHRKFLNELVYDLAYYQNFEEANKEFKELKKSNDIYKISFNIQVKLTSFGVRIK